MTNYEWDPQKNWENIHKHGISFETASLVFEDEYRIEDFDIEHSNEEDRYIVIGMVHKVLFVVYTTRRRNKRIISARLATEAERNEYYEHRAI